MIFFRYYSVVKLSFDHITTGNNFYLTASRCWDDTVALREMGQKFEFGGTIGYGHSYLEIVCCHCKILKLHVTIHDAAGAVG